MNKKKGSQMFSLFFTTQREVHLMLYSKLIDFSNPFPLNCIHHINGIYFYFIERMCTYVILTKNNV